MVAEVVMAVAVAVAVAVVVVVVAVAVAIEYFSTSEPNLLISMRALESY